MVTPSTQMNPRKRKQSVCFSSSLYHWGAVKHFHLKITECMHGCKSKDCGLLKSSWMWISGEISRTLDLIKFHENKRVIIALDSLYFVSEWFFKVMLLNSQCFIVSPIQGVSHVNGIAYALKVWWSYMKSNGAGFREEARKLTFKFSYACK